MTEFKKGVALKTTPLLIVFIAMLLAPTLRAEATVIKDLRFGDNKGYVRMVLEFDRPLIPPPSFSINRNTLQVALTGIINNLSSLRTGGHHGDIVNVEVSKRSHAMRIDAVFSFEPVDVKTFSLTGPHRFIIDAYRPVPVAVAKPPVENARRIGLIEETVPLPEPYSEPEEPLSNGKSPSIDASSIKVHDSTSRLNGNADDSRRNWFQQRLIGALIVVTSIIVVLLFFLIWMGRGRKKPLEPSWIRDLPPTTDRNIESIDSKIDEHLNTHGHG